MLFKKSKSFNFLINLIILNWDDVWDFSAVADCSDTAEHVSTDDTTSVSWELIAVITDLRKLQIRKCACLWSLIHVWSCCTQMQSCCCASIMFYFLNYVMHQQFFKFTSIKFCKNCWTFFILFIWTIFLCFQKIKLSTQNIYNLS